MAFYNLLLCIVMLFIVPLLVGGTVCGALNIETGYTKSYAIGTVGIWALCQIVSVPLILLKCSFDLVVYILSFAVLILCCVAIVKRLFPRPALKGMDKSDVVAVVVMLILIGAFFAATIMYQHIDEDDSRFIGNAVEMCRTGNMFLNNPATGEYIGVWKGELVKDVTAPYAVYIAWMSRLTGVYATTLAHTALPIALYSVMFAVLWQLAGEIAGELVMHRAMFVVLVLTVLVFGYYSKASAAAYIMTRIWQGKSVVAGVGLPLVLLISLWILKEPEKKSNYILLLLALTAMCLLSGMGLVEGALLVGVLGLSYGVAKKNIMLTVRMWITVFPCVLYYLINVFIG